MYNGIGIQAIQQEEPSGLQRPMQTLKTRPLGLQGVEVQQRGQGDEGHRVRPRGELLRRIPLEPGDASGHPRAFRTSPGPGQQRGRGVQANHPEPGRRQGDG